MKRLAYIGIFFFTVICCISCKETGYAGNIFSEYTTWNFEIFEDFNNNDFIQVYFFNFNLNFIYK